MANERRVSTDIRFGGVSQKEGAQFMPMIVEITGMYIKEILEG
jgi:hypothetical protein